MEPHLKYIPCVYTSKWEDGNLAGRITTDERGCPAKLNAALRQVGLQFLFDGAFVHRLTAVQAVQNFVHDLLGLVTLAM
jgi:hypothetical protein